ncbi:MAG: VWA domain-containing protein [Acidobacteria bacterium]|nr:VWA domain-containing protein [Acidobacteriota bacterium]
MKRVFYNIFILLFFLAVPLSLLLGQEKIPRVEFKVEVNLIQLPVHVIGKDGKPVSGLTLADFEVKDEGKLKKLAAVDYVVNDYPNIERIRALPPSARRHFILLFDTTFSNPMGIIKAREAALNFLNKLLPTDLVAVVTYSLRGGINLVVNFTNDKNQLALAISTLGLKQALNVEEPAGYIFTKRIAELGKLSEEAMKEPQRGRQIGVSEAEMLEMLKMYYQALRRSEKRSYEAYVTDFVGQLTDLASGLAAMDGQKNIIYFSDGFDSSVLTGKSLKELEQDTVRFITGRYYEISTDRFGSGALNERIRNMLKHFQDADCSIYAVDTARLAIENLSLGLDAIHRGQTTLNLFASGTGGKLFANTNDLNKPLEDILNLTKAYYILSYYPDPKWKKGKFHRVSVKVKRPGVKVYYRKGYFYKKPYSKFTPMEKKIQLAEYIVKDIISQKIRFSPQVASFKGNRWYAKVPVFLQIPGKQLVELKKEGKKKELFLEVYGYAINAKSNKFEDFFFQRLKVSPSLYPKLAKRGLKYFDMLFLPEGEYKIKCIVRESELGNISSSIRYITVPDFGKDLYLSGPFFVEQERGWLRSRGFSLKNPGPRKKGMPLDYPYTINGRDFIPGVTPVFTKESSPLVFIKLYNLTLHPKANIPQTKIRFQASDERGEVKNLHYVGLANKDIDQEKGEYGLLFLMDLGKENLPPGWYQLKVTVEDTLAKRSVSGIAPFIVQ